MTKEESMARLCDVKDNDSEVKSYRPRGGGIMLAIVILLWLCVLSVPAFPVTVTARGKFNPDDHESFSGIPSDVLFEKGTGYLDIALTEPDSAMLCFSIIAGRYEDHPSLNEAQTAVSSLINMSYLWRESYYDYARAYSANLKALKIAEEQNLSHHKPYIYMGMASILQYVELDGSPIETPTVWLSKALKAAIADHNNTLVQYATINLCESAVLEGDTKNVEKDLNLIKDYNFADTTANAEYTDCFLNAIDCLRGRDYGGMLREFDRVLALSPFGKDVDGKLNLMALKMKISTMKMAGQTDSIPILLNSMLVYANRMMFQEYTLYALKELRDYYGSAGNREAARSYDYRYLHFNDSIQRHNNITRVKDMAFIAGLEEARDNVRRISARKRQNELVALCVGIVSAIVIASLILYIRSQKRLHEANVSLYNRLQQGLNKTGEITAADMSCPVPDGDAADCGTANDSDSSPSAGVSPEYAAEIFSKATRALESSPEIYSQEFSIRTLAEIIGEPYYAVSAAINYCSGSNFKTMLLDYRLREACRRLSDYQSYGNQTIESIAVGLGFKSRTYFNSVFKKHTGLTPAVYMKIARSKSEDKTEPSQNDVL